VIVIGYRFNPALEAWMRQNNLLQASEADLRVQAARGDLALQLNGVDFGTRSGEVALMLPPA
jgi:hypothetical protein